MAELFSRYTSGLQFTAGTINGSANGVSGLNAIVDRLNSIAPNGSQISGTNLTIYADTGQVGPGFTAGSGIEILNGSVVGLGSVTSYYTIAGAKFQPHQSLSDYITYGTGGAAQNNGSVFVTVVASIELPQNVVVTEAIVYGSDPTSNWAFTRANLNTNPIESTLASNTIGSSDTSITNPIVDNSTYRYQMTVDLSAPATLRSAKLTYITNYD